MNTNVISLIGRAAQGTGQPRSPASDTAVYSVKEVAALLDLSLGSTYALVRDGTIPAKQLGGRWVIPKERFHAWLNETPEDAHADAHRADGRGH